MTAERRSVVEPGMFLTVSVAAVHLREVYNKVLPAVLHPKAGVHRSLQAVSPEAEDKKPYMSNPFFKFKQFTVFHDKCAMKVGVDGVTLGAWADVSDVKSILDVGCGSGLITLMLAQRCEARITAIDIDKQSIVQTRENVGNSPWDYRISVIHTSFQQFASGSSAGFDLIVCNPPFFINSMKSPSESRTKARHSDSLPFLELILNAKKMMTEKGRLCVILPVPEGKIFNELAVKEKLFCSRLVNVFPNPEKPAKRLLMEYQMEVTDCKTEELIIEKERNLYTPEYSALVKDFYLNKN